MRAFSEWWRSEPRLKHSDARLAEKAWRAAKTEIAQLCEKLADDQTASEGYRLAAKDIKMWIKGAL